MKITFLGLLHIENLHKYELKNLVFWFLSALTFFFTHRPIYDMKTIFNGAQEVIFFLQANTNIEDIMYINSTQ